VTALVESCHQELRRTNGAVVSLASIDPGSRTLVWLGVGNVEAMLLRRDPLARPPRESLLLRGGVVGYQLPPLRPTALPLFPGDLLVFVTDGIGSNFTSEIVCADPVRNVADRILARCGKTTDDALVLVARFLGEST
jgi:hypothetical protein